VHYLLLLSCLAMSSRSGVLTFGLLMSKWLHTRHDRPSIISPRVEFDAEGAGTQIVMVPLNEEAVRFTRGAFAPETWKRCKPPS
jgi:hypothetical protein